MVKRLDFDFGACPTPCTSPSIFGASPRDAVLRVAGGASDFEAHSRPARATFEQGKNMINACHIKNSNFHSRQVEYSKNINEPGDFLDRICILIRMDNFRS